MAKEIERRFLVQKDRWQTVGRDLVSSICPIRQGFLSTVKERVVRVRVAGEEGTLTIKGLTHGFSRAEFEYAIPLADAQVLLDELCEQTLIEKIRHRVQYAGLVWEVDEFLGANQGLLLAEVELTDEQQAIVFPDWIGQEISADPRYFNANLSANPFKGWGQAAG